MRWVKKDWRQLKGDPIRLDTLAGSAGRADARGRIGIALSATPKMDGSIELRTAYRTRTGKWRERYLASKPEVMTLEGATRERVLRQYHKVHGLETLQNFGKGFSGNLGADPEIFAIGTDGQVLPAWEFLPPKGDGNEVFWDGFQAEFVTTTESCLAWYLDHVRKGLQHVHQAAAAKQGKLVLQDVIEVPLEVLEKAEHNHVRFGCDPSKNAYNDGGRLEADPRRLQVRFAGAHMHFGITNLTETEAVSLVKALDAIFGVATVSMFEGFENPLRRIYYGKAGEYRLPSHGLEYRTPSNAWLCHPAISHLSWILARLAVKVGQHGYLSAWDATETETRRVINETDVAGARKILTRNKHILKALLGSYFESNHSRFSEEEFKEMQSSAIHEGVRVILEGVAPVLEAPKDLVKNWMLNAPTDKDRWNKPSDEQRDANVWLLHTESRNKQWMDAASVIARGQKI